jgi:hypothetical protein
MEENKIKDNFNMQVITYGDGIAQIKMSQNDFNDIKNIVENAMCLDDAFLSSSESFGLPAIDQGVIIKLRGELESAQLNASTHKAILPANEDLVNYLDVILSAAASRGTYENFARDDGTLIDTHQKVSLSEQISLISVGFQPEDIIRKLEKIDNVQLPRFPGG